MGRRFKPFLGILFAAMASMVSIKPLAWAQYPMAPGSMIPSAAVVLDLSPDVHGGQSNTLAIVPDRPIGREESANIDLQWRGLRLVDQVFANDTSRTEAGNPGGQAHRISQLTWDATFPAVAIDILDLTTDVANGTDHNGIAFWIGGSGLGLGNSKPMEDLDWLTYGPSADMRYPDYGEEDGYSFRTLSPNTSLDWAGGLDLHRHSTVNPGARGSWPRILSGVGLQMDAQQWSARGAEGAYSDVSLFDTPVDLPNDILAVTLAHWSLAPYVSVGGIWQQGPATFDIESRAGLATTFTHDQHGQRDLDIQAFGMGWHAGLESRASFVLGDQADIYLAGEVQRTSSYGLWRRNHWQTGSAEHPTGETVQWLRWQTSSSHIDTHVTQWSFSTGVSLKF